MIDNDSFGLGLLAAGTFIFNQFNSQSKKNLHHHHLRMFGIWSQIQERVYPNYCCLLFFFFSIKWYALYARQTHRIEQTLYKTKRKILHHIACNIEFEITSKFEYNLVFACTLFWCCCCSFFLINSFIV